MIKKGIVYGVGRTDLPTKDETGKSKTSYEIWKDMLERCYSVKFHLRKQTYIGCTVCDEWLTYSKFEQWFDENHIKGHHLDKDVAIPGNKVYSADTCMFITPQVNTLLNTHDSTRGLYPLGVDKRNEQFRAQINKYGKKYALGLYDTPEEAHAVYIDAKFAHVVEVANQQTDIRVKRALIRQAQGLI